MVDIFLSIYCSDNVSKVFKNYVFKNSPYTLICLQQNGLSTYSNLVSFLFGSLAPYLRRAAVIDAGCGVLKAGFCGEITPKCYCPSVIGVPRRFSQDVSKMKKGYYVGDEAWSYAGMLQIGKCHSQKMKFSIKDFFSKCDQIRKKKMQISAVSGRF